LVRARQDAVLQYIHSQQCCCGSSKAKPALPAKKFPT
jgi:hypothetical protein